MSIGTLESYLGQGRFVIRLHNGAAMHAQVLPVPGQCDNAGRVYTPEAIDDIAKRIIGDPVEGPCGAGCEGASARMVGFSIEGNIKRSHVEDGMTIVDEIGETESYARVEVDVDL